MTSSFSQQDLSKAGIRKNRACDECRSRKLACSKEPDGCSRCRREGVRCHYSAQKPMGRPRKRRHTEDRADDEAQEEDDVPKNKQEANYQEALHMGASHDMADRGLGFDPLLPTPMSDMSTLPLNSSLESSDQSNPLGGAAFVDFVPEQPPYYGLPMLDQASDMLPKDAFSQGFSTNFEGMDFLAGINFEDPEEMSIADVHENITEALRTYVNDASALKEAEITSMSATTSIGSTSPSAAMTSCADSSTPPADGRRPRPVPSVNCSCLSSLYMALDSLSRLPNDVRAAMRVARNTCKVAHDVVMCPVCSLPLINDPVAPPTIQAWQNLMLLAALLPSACNAYAQILELVDQETASAKEEGKTIHFTFKDVGGIWGYVVDDGSPLTSTIAYFNDTDMAPDLWRTAVRAMLKLDVYGFGKDAKDQLATEARSQYRQLGLRDVVELLDRRHAERHDRMDEAAARGEVPKHSDYILFPGSHKPVPKDQRNCVKILDAVRMALDNLVIA